LKHLDVPRQAPQNVAPFTTRQQGHVSTFDNWLAGAAGPSLFFVQSRFRRSPHSPDSRLPQAAKYAALRAVNKELAGLYWDIGRIIVERQASEGWG